MSYDLAVVGGGPGGLSAALAALDADPSLDVAVLEAGVPREERDDPGADSTDAAGLLDYWRELGRLDDDLLDGVVHREISQVDFRSGDAHLAVTKTGQDTAYDHVAYTFDRVALDDRLRERAGDAGAEYRVGARVADVTTDLRGDALHTLELAGGETVEADALVLADGPKRRATLRTLSQFLPEETVERVHPGDANHVAYQEYRRFPDGAFAEISDRLVFYWGAIPGETAYAWLFPNDDGVVRVGMTMPTGNERAEIADPARYGLLADDETSLPAKSELVTRLLEREFGDEYDADDFPRVEDRGKRDGIEGYQISSTRPIDSPVEANVAVVGGAMGATSAFHEGGYHLARRTGLLAGELAAEGDLDAYNEAWRRAVGEEVLINCCLARALGGRTPEEWAETFDRGAGALKVAASDDFQAAKLAWKYLTDGHFRRDVNAFVRARNHLTAGLLPFGSSDDPANQDFGLVTADEYAYPASE